jgi:hypothetical protein
MSSVTSEMPGLSFSIPEVYAQRTAQMRGEAGQEWINRLPYLLGEYARKWTYKLIVIKHNFSI